MSTTNEQDRMALLQRRIHNIYEETCKRREDEVQIDLSLEDMSLILSALEIAGEL